MLIYVDKFFIWPCPGDVVPSVVMTEVKAFKKVMSKQWFHMEGDYMCTFDFRVTHIKMKEAKVVTDWKRLSLDGGVEVVSTEYNTIDYTIDIEVRNFKVVTTINSPKPKYYLDISGKKPNRSYIRLFNEVIRLQVTNRIKIYLEGFNLIIPNPLGENRQLRFYSINKVKYI